MALVNFTTRANLVGGNPENIADVADCLDKLQTGVNNVESANIVDGTITGTDIASGTVTSGNILDGTLAAADLGSTLADYLGVTAGATSRRGISDAAAEVTTTSLTYVTLAGDSLITVTQPANGLTFLWAQVEAKNSAGGGVESTLGYQVDGVTNVTIMTNMFNTAYDGLPKSTGSSAGVLAPWGIPNVFDLPGTHGYRLVYKVASASTGSYKNRKLRVWTMGF